MIQQAKHLESEISSLACSIKHNLLNPTEKEIEQLEERLSTIEKSLLFLNKAYFAAAIIFATTVGTLFYYILR